MPRHADPRLRLTRVEHGYQLPARGSKLAASSGAFEDQCGCGMPQCSWIKARGRRERGYKQRVGSWQSGDKRFTLTWEGSRGIVSRSHPQGYLRMWDAVLLVVSWHVSMREARSEMKRRYER